MLSLLRNELLLRPVYNILLLLLELFRGNLWWAIIGLTVIVRLALSKSTAAWSAMQSQMNGLQPKMQELQEKHKDDPEKLSKEMMDLLKKDGAWPLKWCLWMLVQMPVFLWLYAVVSNIANPTTMQSWMKFPVSTIDMVYSFLYPIVHQMIDIAALDKNFIGIDVLSKNHIGIAVAAGLLMRINMKIMWWTRPSTPTVPGANVPDMTKMMDFMNIFLVIMITSFVYSVATGVGLYIVTSTLVWVLQTWYQNRILINAKLQTLFKKS